MKVRAFLEQHADHLAIQKLKRAEQMTKSDLDELERMFIEEGVSDAEKLDELRADGGLGVFLRSLTGLHRPSAKDAFSQITSSGLTSSQMEFVNLIIDHLSEAGKIDPARFYESPFTDIDAHGIDGLFQPEQVKELIEIVRRIEKSAAA
jgi:type I restriction enzyme R subunit